jgi:hypothetical protein
MLVHQYMVTHREHITLHVKPNTNARPPGRDAVLYFTHCTLDARIAADEKTLREAADRLAAPMAAPKSD